MVTTPRSLRLLPLQGRTLVILSSHAAESSGVGKPYTLRRSACCVDTLEFDWMFSHGFLHPRNKNSGVIKGVGRVETRKSPPAVQPEEVSGALLKGGL